MTKEENEERVQDVEEDEREKCVVSCSDVGLDQNKSQQKRLRQRAGGRHWCVNRSVCECV